MKIRALANGDVIEENEDAAKELIAAGLYEAVDEKEEKKETRAPVAPMTTEDMPKQRKGRKPQK